VLGDITLIIVDSSTLIILESSTTTSKAQQKINGGVFVVFVLGEVNFEKFQRQRRGTLASL